METKAAVFEDTESVREQLKLIADLTVQPLAQVVRHIANIDSGYDEDYPSWSPPIATAGEAVNMLRKQLKPNGWLKEDSHGFELTVSECGTTAINIAKGTEHVGIDGPDPETVSDKGPCSRAAIDINQSAFDFIKDEEEDTIIPNVQTWWLLYFRDGNTYRSEISLPILMVGKKIARWRTRILLPDISLTDPSGVIGDAVSASSPVVVPIKKRNK